MDIRQIARSYYGFIDHNKKQPAVVIMSKNIFDSINYMGRKEQQERRDDGLPSIPDKEVRLMSIFGCNVRLDINQPSNTFRFE